jgi:crotonobetainyl-CoA:carnitine CoA-transferase CaiB-like acyl-CoA transferase
MVASRLRTVGEWETHDHGRAVADLPVLEIIRIGDATVEPLPDGAAPLSGVRVADLTRVIAGPICGRTLAAYGADVLRIGAPHLPVIGSILADTNLGKRWADIDLRDAGACGRFRELVRTGDVVVQGYRPGGLTGLGLGPEALAELRPGLVYATLSAYSHVGPWRDRRGFDSLVQTATGIGAAGAEAAGVAGTRPLPAQALDHGAGWLLAFGVMEAIRRRATEGGSWHVRTSLVQVRTFLGRLGRVDALDVGDPGPADVTDLLTTTTGPAGSVGHVALPGMIDGRVASWTATGTRQPTDRPEWRV